MRLHGTRLADAVHSVLPLHEDLVAGIHVLREMAIEDALDPCAVVQEAAKGVAVSLRAKKRIAGQHDVQAVLAVGESVTTALQFVQERRAERAGDTPEPPHAQTITQAFADIG